MRVTLWGTRGSLPTPGPSSQRYGGNTSCVGVETDRPEHVVVLDAGSGIRALGGLLPDGIRRIDILLTHLHMDHILGLGFFEGFFRPGLEVHVWGPGSTTLDLQRRLPEHPLLRRH